MEGTVISAMSREEIEEQLRVTSDEHSVYVIERATPSYGESYDERALRKRDHRGKQLMYRRDRLVRLLKLMTPPVVVAPVERPRRSWVGTFGTVLLSTATIGLVIVMR
jgi:hypothetical protein